MFGGNLLLTFFGKFVGLRGADEGGDRGRGTEKGKRPPLRPRRFPKALLARNNLTSSTALPPRPGPPPGPRLFPPLTRPGRPRQPPQTRRPASRPRPLGPLPVFHGAPRRRLSSIDRGALASSPDVSDPMCLINQSRCSCSGLGKPRQFSRAEARCARPVGEGRYGRASAARREVSAGERERVRSGRGGT